MFEILPKIININIFKICLWIRICKYFWDTKSWISYFVLVCDRKISIKHKSNNSDVTFIEYCRWILDKEKIKTFSFCILALHYSWNFQAYQAAQHYAAHTSYAVVSCTAYLCSARQYDNELFLKEKINEVFTIVRFYVK